MSSKTTGQELKKLFGLDSLPVVKLTRVLASTYRIYIIFYNSRIPTMPITSQRAISGYMPSTLLIPPFRKRPTMTPLMDLADFNGSTSGALFFTVDMAGSYGNSRKLNHFIEGKLNDIQEEFLTHTKNMWSGAINIPIFKNPTTSEMRELSRVGERGIFDSKTNNIYVASAEDILHEGIISSLEKENELSWNDNQHFLLFIGSAREKVLTVYSNKPTIETDKRFIQFRKSSFYKRYYADYELDVLYEKTSTDNSSKFSEKFAAYVPSPSLGYGGGNDSDRVIFKDPSSKELSEFKPFGEKGIYNLRTGDVFVASAFFVIHSELYDTLISENILNRRDNKNLILFQGDPSRQEILVYPHSKYTEFVKSDFFQRNYSGYKLIINKGSASLDLIERYLKEALTLGALKDTSSASELTKSFRRSRNGLIGAENKTSKLIDCVIDEGDGSVTFQFLTDVTPYENPDHTYGETDPDDAFKIKRNRSKSYELQIKILEFFSWLDTYPDKAEITREDIADILDISNVQVFSTSPSLHWQGLNYNLSQLDASIHSTDIAPEFWNQSHLHGDNAFLDKHLYGLLRSIDFFEQQMASMLSKKLKDRGLM